MQALKLCSRTAARLCTAWFTIIDVKIKLKQARLTMRSGGEGTAMKNNNFIKDVALLSILSATLIVSKLALSFIPNVEAVTFLIIVYTAALGFKRGFAVALIFALTDGLIYGYSYYTISYAIQFPSVAVVTAVVSRRRVKSEYAYTAAAFLAVLFFGVHSSLLDSVVLHVPFWPRYLSGILFYCAEILSATVLTLFAFKPLYGLLKNLTARYYGGADKKNADNPPPEA
jgi:energy-coupling factor transport system substrate-specific component